MTFSKPQNCYTVSQRERIPPKDSTTKKPQNKTEEPNRTCLHTVTQKKNLLAPSRKLQNSCVGQSLECPWSLRPHGCEWNMGEITILRELIPVLTPKKTRCLLNLNLISFLRTLKLSLKTNQSVNFLCLPVISSVCCNKLVKKQVWNFWDLWVLLL